MNVTPRTLTVGALIEFLQKMPQKAPVALMVGAEAENGVESCWLSRGGHVVLSEGVGKAYRTEDRPDDAPDAEAEPFWKAGAGARLPA